MSMTAQISFECTKNILVIMRGGFDYENSMPLRHELNKLRASHPEHTITLDFKEVDFVGSSGIGIFVETLNMINQLSLAIQLINIKPEFIKVFKLYNLLYIEEMVEEVLVEKNSGKGKKKVEERQDRQDRPLEESPGGI